jgi:hypothetical protein
MSDVTHLGAAMIGYFGAWGSILVAMWWERFRNKQVLDQLAELRGGDDEQ